MNWQFRDHERVVGQMDGEKDGKRRRPLQLSQTGALGWRLLKDRCSWQSHSLTAAPSLLPDRAALGWDAPGSCFRGGQSEEHIWA